MTRQWTADVVVCGAGIAGISAAYHLAVRRGVTAVVLVDERPPLSLTSDKSTECYRTWWPGPDDAMVRLMERSLDLLDELALESHNRFHLQRQGYAYFTADRSRLDRFEAAARATARLGAGELRLHPGPGASLRPDEPTGADLVLDAAAIRTHFPFLSDDVAAVLLPRRSGWLSAQQLGMYLLEESRRGGVRLVRGRVQRLELDGDGIAAVEIAGGDIETIATRRFVNAGGPLAGQVGELLGVPLPLHNELHAKLTLADPRRIIPRDVPLLIWCDPIRLPWTTAEEDELRRDPELAWLLEELPGGVHFRPEGGPESDVLILLWAYHTPAQAPVFPPRFDPVLPEVVLRGAARMVPALGDYLAGLRAPFVDGGYYCKTPDNRPLIGPLSVPGAYVLAGLSGYGIMASQGAAELLAAQLTGDALPAYAPAFALERFADPAYRRRLASWDAGEGEL